MGNREFQQAWREGWGTVYYNFLAEFGRLPESPQDRRKLADIKASFYRMHEKAADTTQPAYAKHMLERWAASTATITERLDKLMQSASVDDDDYQPKAGGIADRAMGRRVA
jgi:hypothetical protein